MTKKETIRIMINKIKHYAYQARIMEELKFMKFDVNMMNYYQHTDNGKAFGIMETLTTLYGISSYSDYENAVEEAIQDIHNSNGDIIKLLNLAGFSGEEYYKVQMKYCY